MNVLFGAALSLYFLKVCLTATLAQGAKHAEAAGRSLRHLLVAVAVAAVHAHGRNAGVTCRIILDILRLAVERRQDKAEPLALRGNKAHFFTRVAQVRRDEVARGRHVVLGCATTAAGSGGGATGSRDSAGQQAVKVAGGGCAGSGPSRRGDAESSKQRLRVALRTKVAWSWWLWGLRRHAQDVLAQVVDCAAEVGDAGRLEALVGAGYKFVYVRFILLEKRVDMFLVYDAGALRLREDEIEEE